MTKILRFYFNSYLIQNITMIIYFVILRVNYKLLILILKKVDTTVDN